MSGMPGRQSGDTRPASPRYFPPILCSSFETIASELFTVINIDSIGAQRSGDSVGVLWAGFCISVQIDLEQQPCSGQFIPPLPCNS